MARSTGRLVRPMTKADSRNAVASAAVLDVIGHNANGSNQVAYLVMSSTKVAAAAFVQRALGDSTARPAEFSDSDGLGNDHNAVRRALDVRDGDVAVWRRSGDGNPIALLREGQAPEVVAHWRYDNVSRSNRVVLIGQDPLLLTTRVVSVPEPLSTESQSIIRDRKYRHGIRSDYVGGVNTHTESADVFVTGLGNLSVTAAEELLRGLAGALAEIAARKEGNG